MPDINPSAPAAEPEVTTPQTYDDQVEELSELLGDPETDPAEAEEPEAAPTDDDPDGLNEIGAEDVEVADASDTTEDEDGPDAEVKGGRFAPDSAKVKLDNGETISIADLKVRVEKRVRDFQRGFTEKSQGLAAKEAEVDQYVQSLNQARDYIAWYAEQHIPKDPGPWTGDQDDFVGYQNWQKARDTYGQHLQAYQLAQQLKQTEDQRKAGETKQQAEARWKEEAEALKKTYPILTDPAKGPLFLQATARDATKYFNLTADELSQTIQDRRFFGILRDAISFRRLKEKAPQVKDEIVKRPAMTNGRRAGPNATEVKSKQVRTERLRKTGSFEDGVAALQDFDL
jgi:hypothetical protein